ncbi:MAG: translocation/assembly module TamB domain-containing protein, partial [Flavitalea sp.]
MLVLIALIILAWLLVQTTFFQNFIVGTVTKKLSKNLNTTVQIKHVDFDLFNYMLLEGTLVKDQRKDTLLYAGTATVNLTDWFFFSDSVELKYIGLKDAVIHINRTDSVWNYQFLIDYFASPTPAKKQQRDINLKLKQLELENISIVQKDGWRGENLTANLESLDLESEIFDLKNKRIKINSLDIVKPYFAIYNYKGNPARKPRPPSEEDEIVNDPNRLRWNAEGWNVSITKFLIRNGSFSNDIETGNKPMSTFDGQHISFSSINGDFENIQFVKDSLTAKVLLSTNERSGFQIKKLAANMRLHPEAMEFANLELRTNKSYLHDYFALRYNTFDDMAYFISKVRMEANFNKTKLHSDDIAFFAPTMKDWKKDIEISGTMKGTVENLNGKNLIIKAGSQSY